MENINSVYKKIGDPIDKIEITSYTIYRLFLVSNSSLDLIIDLTRKKYKNLYYKLAEKEGILDDKFMIHIPSYSYNNINGLILNSLKEKVQRKNPLLPKSGINSYVNIKKENDKEKIIASINPNIRKTALEQHAIAYAKIVAKNIETNKKQKLNMSNKIDSKTNMDT